MYLLPLCLSTRKNRLSGGAGRVPCWWWALCSLLTSSGWRSRKKKLLSFSNGGVPENKRENIWINSTFQAVSGGLQGACSLPQICNVVDINPWKHFCLSHLVSWRAGVLFTISPVAKLGTIRAFSGVTGPVVGDWINSQVSDSHRVTGETYVVTAPSITSG